MSWQRATPYQVLAEFAEHTAGQLDAATALRRMTALLGGPAGGGGRAPQHPVRAGRGHGHHGPAPAVRLIPGQDACGQRLRDGAEHAYVLDDRVWFSPRS